MAYMLYFRAISLCRVLFTVYTHSKHLYAGAVAYHGNRSWEERCTPLITDICKVAQERDAGGLWTERRS